ncbi:MAG: AAA family ATPase [Thermoplasmata archaeon]|nr:AAA family ATPase [Thermoplasmata archaeon]
MKSTTATPETRPTTAPNAPDPRAAPSGDPHAPVTILNQLTAAVGESVIGYDRVVQLLAVALSVEGHVLLEGVPGIAKTLLVRRFAATLSLTFKRIQFTPDMLPSDIVGTVILNPTSREFEFRRGPVFANVVLADEINRAPPKVQSALLEAMQERQVTVDGVGYALPRPFMVIATQNPIEQEGTYPLPEAELDRLLFRILMGYPGEADERKIIERHAGLLPAGTEAPPIDVASVERLREAVAGVRLTPELLNYVVSIVRSTRDDPQILMGASPRAAVQFVRAAKAAAVFAGRDFVTPGDAKSVAFEVMNHRIVLQPDLIARQYVSGKTTLEPLLRQVLEKRINQLPAPR